MIGADSIDGLAELRTRARASLEDVEGVESMMEVSVRRDVAGEALLVGG